MERNMIRVVLLEPQKEARIADIGSSLQSMQSVVGGLIEAVYPFEEQVCIVCNEEGKLQGLPLNRALRDSDDHIYDIIAGTAFLCDCSEEDFGSLTDEQAAKYLALFKRPEAFVSINGCIIAVPLEDGDF